MPPLFFLGLTRSVKCIMVPSSQEIGGEGGKVKGLKGLTRFSIMSFTTSEAKEVSREGLDSSGLLLALSASMLPQFNTVYVLCV